MRRKKDTTGRKCRICGDRYVTTGSRSGVCGVCYRATKKKVGKTSISADALRAAAAEAERVSGRVVCDVPTWDAPPALVADDCVVCSDIHVPRHVETMIERMTAVAQRDGLRTLVIGGDLIDFEEISRHRKAGAKGITARDSIIASMQLLDDLCETFDTIHVIKGNHDDRLQRTIEAAIEGRSQAQWALADIEGEQAEALTYRARYVAIMEEWARKAGDRVRERVRWYPVPRIEIAGPAGQKPYLLVHPSIYSRLAPQAERRIWTRYVQPIIGTHGHLAGLSLSPNGEHPVLQIGCMTDPSKHLYLSENVTDHPQWVNCFATIRSGVLRMYVDNPYLTDWGREIGEGAA